jgi:magnesium-transporting ATPase (P-type)
MQIVNVFLCRSATRSLRATGLAGNVLILWGVALEAALVLLIDYTAWGNVALGTAPLSWPLERDARRWTDASGLFQMRRCRSCL